MDPPAKEPVFGDTLSEKNLHNFTSSSFSDYKFKLNYRFFSEKLSVPETLYSQDFLNSFQQDYCFFPEENFFSEFFYLKDPSNSFKEEHFTWFTLAKKRFNLFLDFLVKINQLNDFFYKLRLPLYSNIFFYLKDSFLDLFNNDLLLNKLTVKKFEEDVLIKCFTSGLLFLHNHCNSSTFKSNIKLNDYTFFFESINYFSFKDLFKDNFFTDFNFDFFFKHVTRHFFSDDLSPFFLGELNNFSESLEKIAFNNNNFLHEFLDSVYRNQVHKDVIFFLKLDPMFQKKIDDSNFAIALN